MGDRGYLTAFQHLFFCVSFCMVLKLLTLYFFSNVHVIVGNFAKQTHAICIDLIVMFTVLPVGYTQSKVGEHAFIFQGC